jgi:phage FluMu protein Com
VSIDFRCRRCNRRLSLDRRTAGQTVPCPRCKTTLKVPAAGSAPAVGRLGLLGPLIAVPLVVLAIAVGLLLRSARAGTGTLHDPDLVAVAHADTSAKPERGDPTPPRIEPPADPPALPEPTESGRDLSPAHKQPVPRGPATLEPEAVALQAPPKAAAAPVQAEARKVHDALQHSAIAAVLEANGGKVPATGEEVATALARVGPAAQLAIPFSAVQFDSGLANPRIVFVSVAPPDARGGRAAAGTGLGRWSPATAEGPARPATISQAEVNTPDFTGRLFLTVNMERGENRMPRARSVEFISWNSQRKRFDFGLIDNLGGPGPPQLAVVDGVKCFSCHKTHGPILGGGPWSNTNFNSLLQTAVAVVHGLPPARPDPGRVARPRLPGGIDPDPPPVARFDGFDVFAAQALEVDAQVRLGAERLRNREAFRLMTRYTGGPKMLALLFGGLVTPGSHVKAGDNRTKGSGSHDAVPLAKIDEDLKAMIDLAFPPGSFSDRWHEFQKGAPSSILLDFSPAGPPPARPYVEWGGNTTLVKKYDALRADGSVALPSLRQPSNPKAFLKQTFGIARAAKIVNVTRLAETIGVSEADRDFLARTLVDAADRAGSGKVTPAALAAAVFEGSAFADVLKDGTLPDRDELKDRFLAGLKEILDKKFNQSTVLSLGRSDYASMPEFTPGGHEPEPVLVPTTACLRCHEIRPVAKAKFIEPMPSLAFDPFDKKAREAWVRTSEPQRRQQVLSRMLKRLAEDKDMPPEDAPEFDKFRTGDPPAFDAVRDFLEAELKKAKGD